MIKKIVFLILFATVMASAGSSMAGEWMPVAIEVTGDAGSSDESSSGAAIDWEWSADCDGLGVYVSAEVYDHFSTTTISASPDVDAQCKKAWRWEGEGAIGAVQFTMQWSGKTTGSICTADAEPHHKSDSYIYSYVRVSSSDFAENDNDKWMAISKRKAELPMNPPTGEEAKQSQPYTADGSIDIKTELPGGFTGDMQLDWKSIPGDQRSATGAESSDTQIAGSSTASYDNGCGGGNNGTIDATVYHVANVEINGRSSNGEWKLPPGDDNDYDANAYCKAETTAFTITKD